MATKYLLKLMAGLPQPQTVRESGHNSVAAKLPLLFRRRLVRLVYYKPGNREECRGRGQVSGWDEIAEGVGPLAGEWMSNTGAGTRFAICWRGKNALTPAIKWSWVSSLTPARAQGSQEPCCNVPARQVCICSRGWMLIFPKRSWFLDAELGLFFLWALASKIRALHYTVIGWIQVLKMKQSAFKAFFFFKLGNIDASPPFLCITFLAALSAFLPVAL